MLPKNEELKLKLITPKIYSHVVARREDNYNHLSQTFTRTVFRWFVTMIIPGPDGRFNPGHAELNPSDVRKVLFALNEASNDLSRITQREFTGEYTQFLTEPYSNPAVQIRALDADVKVRILLLSTAFRQFSVDLNSQELTQFIQSLDNCFSQGEKLLEQLRPQQINNLVTDSTAIPNLCTDKFESNAPSAAVGRPWWQFWKT